MLGKLKHSVKTRINETEGAKRFYESENYKKVRNIKENYQEFKQKLSEQIEEAQNPVVQSTRIIADSLLRESSTASAVREMQKYDPTFDLQELNFEVQEIFKEFFCNYLEGNLAYLEKVCGMAGLAIVKSEVKRRETEGWRYRYTDVLDCGQVNFLGANVLEKGVPHFTFTVAVQEIDCKVLAKQPDQVKEGDDSRIVQATYRIVLARHQEPDVALAGHYWEIVEFNKVGELQQIV